MVTPPVSLNQVRDERADAPLKNLTRGLGLPFAPAGGRSTDLPPSLPPSRGPVGQRGPVPGASGRDVRRDVLGDSAGLGPLLSLWMVPEQPDSW